MAKCAALLESLANAILCPPVVTPPFPDVGVVGMVLDIAVPGDDGVVAPALTKADAFGRDPPDAWQTPLHD